MRIQRAATWCLLLSLVGLGLAGYLAVLHIGLMRGELFGGSICGGSGIFNCHAVTASTWGSFLGMPLSLWGIAGYVAAMGLSLLARQGGDWPNKSMTLLLGLSVMFVVADLFLLSIMLFVLQSFCLFCLFTYLVNISILIIAAKSLDQPWMQALSRVGKVFGDLIPSSNNPVVGFFWALVFVGFSASFSLHAATLYVNRGTLGNLQKQLIEYVAHQKPTLPRIEGSPMKGNPSGKLKIVKFSDFLCPVCQKAAKLNKIIAAGHKRDLGYVYKHYPLDSTCNPKISRNVHPGACQIAAATACAHKQGKFWKFHDKVFEEGKDYKTVNLRTDAGRIGLDLNRYDSCMKSGEGMEMVKKDVNEAIKLGVTSTPTHFINGYKFAGVMTPSRFEDYAVAVLNPDKSRSHDH